MGIRLQLLVAVLFAAGVTTGALASRADDVARLHLEAIGGRARVDALTALRANGEVSSGGKRLQFTMVAARPNKVRLETESGGRTLVQATDGREPPWEFDTGTWPPRYRAMAAANADTFTADSEFDDPLVGGEKRGYAIEDAGETEVDGRKLRRVHVTRGKHQSFHLLLDPRTYLILLRVETRKAPDGKSQLMVTRFDNFRAVAGVLLPHTVTLMLDGKVAQTTTIERIDPNPKVTAETFSRPKAAAK